MSLISGIIPAQGFEVVRDTIAAIIKTELDNQKIEQELTQDISVYLGRMSPFQQSERFMINVLLDSSNYSSHSASGSLGTTNFFIDVYVSAKETSALDGGNVASVIRDKYLGMIRYILQDYHYKTLGLTPGLIMGTSVDSIENFESVGNQDAAFVKFGRVSFSVRIAENQSLWEGIEISTIFTKVKLDLTDLGYQYISE